MATSDSDGVCDPNATAAATAAAALVAGTGTDGRAGYGHGYGYGYPTFEDAPFINQPILILDGGSESYPIQNKWIRSVDRLTRTILSYPLNIHISYLISN